MPTTSGMVAAPIGLGGREEAVAVADGIEMILLWRQQSGSHRPLGSKTVLRTSRLRASQLRASQLRASQLRASHSLRSSRSRSLSLSLSRSGTRARMLTALGNGWGKTDQCQTLGAPLMSERSF